MKVSNWLAAAAAAHPERAAVVEAGETTTYGELQRRAVEVERRLVDAGIERRDVVATTMAASAELVTLIHGAMRIGAVVAPLDPGLSTNERTPLLSGLQPELTIGHASELASLPAGDLRSADELELDDVLCVIHTSGSSGRPKPIELTCGNHLWSAVGCGMQLGMDAEDRWLCCLPMHHVGGFAIAIRCAIYGATMVIEPFDAQRTAATIAAGDVTLTSLVSTMLDRMLDAGLAPGALRAALLGGGPASTALIGRAVESGIPIAPTYGLTETCSQVAILPPEEVSEHSGSAGRANPSSRIKIGDDGRIMVSGPTVSRSAASAGGWLATGDLGRIDEDGYLYVLGRADQVIITGGENVSPEEVERAIGSHPDVADVAVFGREDARWQSAVVAAVVPRDGATLDAEALRAFTRERLAGYKVPKRFEFVASLPRNAQGKLLRTRLR